MAQYNGRASHRSRKAKLLMVGGDSEDGRNGGSLADQGRSVAVGRPLRGRRAAALGADNRPIPTREVTARSLAKVFGRATDSGIPRGDHEITRRVRSEEGASPVALLLERYRDKERSAA